MFGMDNIMGVIYLVVALLISVIVLQAFDSVIDCDTLTSTGAAGGAATPASTTCNAIKDNGWLVLGIFPVVLILQVLGVFRGIFSGNN